jgi:hypothetical protein
MTILHSLVPEYDHHEVHELTVAAPPEVVYAAVREVTTAEIRLLRPLMFLRMLPARLRGRRPGIAGSARVIDAFLEAGFTLLGERPGTEIALGAIGRFWSIGGNMPVAGIDTPERFAAFDEPGYAKAALDVRVVPHSRGARVITETRVRSTSPDARRRFGRYWGAIRWGSGAIRRSLLHAIRRRALRDSRR